MAGDVASCGSRPPDAIFRGEVGDLRAKLDSVINVEHEGRITKPAAKVKVIWAWEFMNFYLSCRVFGEGVDRAFPARVMTEHKGSGREAAIVI